jgi:hypothetical protein
MKEERIMEDGKRKERHLIRHIVILPDMFVVFKCSCLSRTSHGIES